MPGPGDKEIADELAKNVPNFDIQAARAAGVPDSLIVNELAPKVPQFDVSAARAHFAGVPAAAPSAPAPTTTPGVDPNRPIQALIDHYADMATLHLGKKAVAGVQSLINGKSYQQNLDQINTDLSEEQRLSPKSSGAANVAGMLLNPLNEIAAPLGLVKGAAAMGAAQGLGSAHDDPKSLLTGAITGGVAGGVTGKAFQYGGQVLQALKSPANAAVGAIRNAIDESGGPSALRTASDKLAGQGAAGQAMLMDLLPSLHNLADHAATADPTARAAISAATTDRQAGMAERAIRFVQSKLGNPEQGQATAAAKTVLRNFADGPQGFGGLEDKYAALPLTPEFHADVLRAPGAVQALEKVNLALKGAGKSDPNDELITSMLKGANTNDMKSLGLTQLLPAGSADNISSYGAVSQLRRVLDHKAEAAFTGSPANPELGQAYKTLRNGVDDFLAKAVPEHAQVNARYGVLKDAMKAVDQGANDWATQADPRVVAAKVAAMAKTPEVLDGYRAGVTSAAIKQMLQADPMKDIASPLTAKASQAKQQLLKTMFGDQATFDQFMGRMQAEKQMAQARSATTGSDTGRRFADMLTLGAGGAGVYAGIAHPAVIPAMLAAAGAKKLAGTAMRARAAELAPWLTSSAAPDAIEGLLSSAYGAQSPLSGPTQAAAIGLAGKVGGVAGGLLSH